MMTILLLFPSGKTVWSEAFSTTNVQVLYGGNFHDPFFGYNTVNGKLTTVTLEHFSTWRYGDNFLFVDLLSGNFADFSGKPAGTTSRIYAEWHPRLSLYKLAGHDAGDSLISDLLLAGQINRDGEGFKADMLGLGINLSIPAFSFVEIDAYARKDNFNGPTWQITTAWSLPLYHGILTFDGYVDVNGTDSYGTEINGQPRLLFDAGAMMDHGGTLQLGVEWYYHHHRLISSSVPQLLIKWAM